VEETTADERRTLASWVREAMAGANEWGRRTLASWLLDLEADTMDDEQVLRVYRETGRRHDLVRRLLELGRAEEAVEEARLAEGYEVIRMADLLVAGGHGTEAEALVRERAREEKDGWLLEWLKKRALKRRDVGEALKLARQQFAAGPSPERYKEIRKLAQKQQCWDEVRPELFGVLKQPRWAYVLVPVLLEEGEIDEALRVMQSRAVPGLELDVARAAEKARPEAALEIYRRHAEAQIRYRGRGSYQAACPLLKKVRDLSHRLGENAAWEQYIARLRQDNRSLRALQEELDRARL
jgi:uncharacterized Zn finger protein